MFSLLATNEFRQIVEKMTELNLTDKECKIYYLLDYITAILGRKVPYTTSYPMICALCTYHS